jgi:leader peptidase (prepilin peptidase)/N-methyltransferase
MIGSFLNVVAWRLPIMMENRWREECKALTESSPSAPEAEQAFNLMIPRSAFPSCGHQISALENIPIISYLFLRGKCRSCQAAISVQYPLVELATALLSAFVVWKLGYTWQALGGLIFTWTLIALSIIDLKTQLLPDSMTLPLLWLGLIINLQNIFTHYSSSLLGAVFGYLSLWLVYHAFKLITGKEGMGYGDFKLLAALGAWMGWQMLPLVIILSSLLGASIGIALMVVGKHKQGVPIPFGPFLAGAGWVAFFWGQQLSDMYLNYSGL